VGLGWAANAVLEIPTMLAFRRIAGRVRLPWLLVAGSGVFALRAIVFTASGDPTGMIVAAALGGVGFALFLVGTTTWIARRAPVQLQATAQALFSSTAYAIGAITGAILAGQIAGHWGLGALFPVATVGSIVGCVLIWLAVVRRTPEATVARTGATGLEGRADAA
jgi:predicted MFS family arabinose efflux permease